MTEPRLRIVGVILVAGLATGLVIQHRARVRLSAENETLRRQNTELDELKLEQVRLSNLVVQTSQPMPVSTDKELLRLRGQVGVLHQQNQDLSKMLLRHPEPASAPGKEPVFEPSASWADAGSATPDSAAQTFCWAIKTGNAAKLAEVLLPPTDASKNPSVALSEIAQVLQPLLEEIESSRFLTADTPAPGETTYWYQNKLKGGQTWISSLTLKQSGGQWKVKLSLDPSSKL